MTSLSTRKTTSAWSLAAFSFVAAATAAICASSSANAGESSDNGVPDFSIARDLPYDAARASMAAAGVTYGLNYTGEYYNVTSGGRSRGSTYNGLIEVYAGLDLEKLLGWNGAAIFANAYYVHGKGPREKTGSFFAISNIEGYETIRLGELWLEQSLFNQKLKVKIGSIHADTMFFVSDTAVIFLNGSFGWPDILASDTLGAGPSYPLASMGAVVSYAPNDKLTLMGALFNGSPANPFTRNPQKANKNGTDFRFGDGALVMIEGNYRYELAGLAGTVRVGGWKQFNAPEGTYRDFRTGTFVNSNQGVYGIIDQMIWKGSGDEIVTVFGRISTSPGERSQMDFYVDTGIRFAGFVPGRVKDSFGAAFGYEKISEEYIRASANPQSLRPFESVFEVNYIAQIDDGVTLSPDFQYFWNPGAVVDVSHGAIAGARLKIGY